MKTLTRVGFAVLVIGALGSIAELVLALTGSRYAPSWLHSFVPQFVAMAGAMLAMIGFSRTMQEYSRTVRIEWTTDNSVPAALSLDRRREFVLRQPAPLIVPILAMALMVATVFAMIAYPDARDFGVLRQRGVETTGTVTAKDLRRDGVDTIRSIEYEFHYRLKTQTGHANTTSAVWDGLKKGSAVPVTFLEAAPFISLPMRRAAMTWSAAYDHVFGDSATMLLIMVGLFSSVFLLRTLQKRPIQLLQTGTAAIATVTNIDGQTIRYAFDASSQAVTGKFTYRTAALPRPAEGDRFVVLYDAQRPSRSIPWPIARTLLQDRGATPAHDAPQSGIIEPSLPASAPARGPARVRLSWQLPLAAIFLTLLMVSPFADLRSALDMRKRVQSLQKSGVETTGEVTNVETFTVRHLDRLRVEYRYWAGSHAYASMFVERSPSRQKRYSIGAATPVTYARENAQVSLPISRKELVTRIAALDGRVDIVGGIVMFAIIAAALLWTSSRAWTEWQFARAGQSAVAVVQEVKGSILRRCRYRFMSTHGDVEQTSRIHSRSFRPAVGDRIEVLYLDHPVRSVAAADLIFVKRT